MTSALDATGQKHDVRDLGLADEGVRRIEWADRQMPVLAAIRERFERERPLEGRRISACLHVTTETANLMRTLAAGGADVVLCASNPLSTQDDVAAALVARYGIPVFAIRGEDHDTYYAHIEAAVEHRPQLTMDDGADVIGVLHAKRRDRLGEIIAATEETTTGVIRLRSMEADGVLGFPVVAVNEAETKHLFDNRYGTGQSTIDGIVRATNVLLAGRAFVVAGFGWCGRASPCGRAGWARGSWSPRSTRCGRSRPRMEGFEVLPMERGRRHRRHLLTATGDTRRHAAEHFDVMKDGAILANTGHFNVEIDIPALEAASRRAVARARARRALHPGRRAAPVPAGRRAAGQPLRRRGPPRRRHGHVLRQPGPLGRVRRAERRHARAQGLRRAPGDRRGDRPAQARVPGHRHRRAHEHAGARTSRPGTRAPDPAARRHPARAGRRRPARPDPASRRARWSPLRHGVEARSWRRSAGSGDPRRALARGRCRHGRGPGRGAGSDEGFEAELGRCGRGSSRASRPTAVNLAWAPGADAMLDARPAGRRPSSGRAWPGWPRGSTTTRSSAAGGWAPTARPLSGAARASSPTATPGRSPDGRPRDRAGRRAAAPRPTRLRVSVAETRPLLQGAATDSLGAGAAGVDHTLVVDSPPGSCSPAARWTQWSSEPTGSARRRGQQGGHLQPLRAGPGPTASP